MGRKIGVADVAAKLAPTALRSLESPRDSHHQGSPSPGANGGGVSTEPNEVNSMSSMGAE